MFFISPIKAVYSIKFYLQTLKEPLWKAFLFFVYLFALGAIFLALYIPIKMGPAVNEGLTDAALRACKGLSKEYVVFYILSYTYLSYTILTFGYRWYTNGCQVVYQVATNKKSPVSMTLGRAFGVGERRLFHRLCETDKGEGLVAFAERFSAERADGDFVRRFFRVVIEDVDFLAILQ